MTDTTRAILKIHAGLQKSPAPENERTALVFLDEEEVHPYELPLGDEG